MPTKVGTPNAFASIEKNADKVSTFFIGYSMGIGISLAKAGMV
jgi:hypothetical protein